MARCEHADGCTEPVIKWVSVGPDRQAGVCASHAAQLERKLEGLRFHVGVLVAEMRCEKCGNLVPEGFLHHDCESPAAQPHADEQ